MNGNKGFSLVELMVVIAIVGALTAFSVPNFIEWTKSARYKEAANLAMTALRKGKGQAINLNQGVTVRFILDSSAANEDNYVQIATGSPPDYVNAPKMFFKQGIEIKRGTLCDGNDDKVSIAFNPTGSSQTGYICIFDGPIKKYKIGIATANPGRIHIEKF